MPKQPAIPGLRDAMKKKLTRREQFLAEIDAEVTWGRLLAPVAPHYLKAGPKGGRSGHHSGQTISNSGMLTATTITSSGRPSFQ